MDVATLSAEQAEVWAAEQNYFRYLQKRDVEKYMSLWDERFVGWPGYSEHPLRKQDIEKYVVEQFQSAKPALESSGMPTPDSIVVIGNVAIAYYFWPDADPSSQVRHRMMHAWLKGPAGWRIIGGMSCATPRPETGQ